MFKNLARRAIGFYLLPLKQSERLFSFVRGEFFTDSSEHLYSATNHIRRHVAPAADEIIIDVGCANGGTAIYFTKAFPGHRVYCFEPNSRMYDDLQAVESKHKQVTVRRVALGSASAEGVLHVTANNLSSSLNELNSDELNQTPAEFQAALREEQKLSVRVSTLDEEFKESPVVLLMKLDTQGTEIEVLKGGVQTLRKTRFVLTEMNNHQLYSHTCQYYEVDEFLRNNDFRLSDIVVTYRGAQGVAEYDALYQNLNL